MVLTDPAPRCGRPLTAVVSECLASGATAIQLRDKEAEAGHMTCLAGELLPLTRAAGALLLVNDRLDVALAAGADGVHLGPDDLPVAAARSIAPPGFLIGYSTDDPRAARQAAVAGADYLGVGAVFGTRSKRGLLHEAIGPDRVREVGRESGLPCVGIGGIAPANADRLFRIGAGVAVLSAVMGAAEPGAAVRAIARAAETAGM